MKKILLSVLVVILSLIALFIVLEILVRIISPQPASSKWFESSQAYGYFNKTDFKQDFKIPKLDLLMKVETNSHGHRYKEYDGGQLTDSAYNKVLLLGDAFVFGYGVNMQDHLATRLDEHLMEAEGSYTVINAGVDGWSTLQELAYAKDHFNIFNPGIVVLFFNGDDPKDDDQFLQEKPDRAKGALQFPGKIFLRDNTHLYRFLYQKYSQRRHKQVIEEKLGGDEELSPGALPGYVITPDQWERTIKTIKEFHSDFLAFDRDGILLVLSTIPWDEEQRDKLGSLDNGTSLFYIDLYDDALTLGEEETRRENYSPGTPSFHGISALRISEKIQKLSVLSPESGVGVPEE